MHISIIGSGYVGLVTGACFAEFGVFVTCVDKDEDKITALGGGSIPFYEPGLQDLVKRNVSQGRLKFTTKIEDAVEESLVIFIAVGTPPRDDGTANLDYVDEAARTLAAHLRSYKVIVSKSTVPVGTSSRIRKIIAGNVREDVQFDVVSNPEFLREGSAIEDFLRPNRVIIGTASPQAAAIMKDLYRPLYLIETPFVITTNETAELIKYASNAFLATKISFINEMSRLCEKIGADVNVVAKGMGLDGRIGSKFLHAGPGFGGSCFPKDTRALVRMGAEHGVELDVIKAAIEANLKQREFVTKKIADALGTLPGKTVAVLGLSFKPNTDDVRESPAIDIIGSLLAEGAAVRAYDPAAMDNARRLLPAVTYCADAYDACAGSDALVIATEWNQFRNLHLARILGLLTQPFFFDLRNVYDPARMSSLGFRYQGVGRPVPSDSTS